MIKKLVFIAIILLQAFAGQAQEMTFKKDTAYVDGKKCLTINASDPNNVSILDLNGNEIIFLKYIHNSRYASIYNKITFLDQKISFTSKSYIFTIKLLLKKLYADKTLTDCALNPDKVEKFVMKYDENVERD